MANAIREPELRQHGMLVIVSIVNYCTARLTIDCLRSLEPEIARRPGCKVVVADNASPDGSGREIAAAIAENNWSDWAELLALPTNGGFAYGNNAVIRRHQAGTASARFFWLLNSDTVVRPGALDALLRFMDANPEAGIAGSCLEDPDGTQQCSAFRFPTLAGEFDNGARTGPISRLLRRWTIAPAPQRKTAEHDWLSGASMLIRASVLQRTGLMDEGFFLYFEETDFCRTVRRQGWSCWQVGDSHVVHLVGRSTGIVSSARRPPRRPQYWFQSRRRYFVKQHGLVYAVAADAALGLGTMIWRLRAIASRQPSDLPERFLRDLVRNSAIWPCQGRKAVS